MRIGWRVAVTSLAIGTAIVGSMVIGAIDDVTARDTAFVIDDFEREVIIDADGTTTVLEIIDVIFSESRRGIFRDLPEEERFPAGSYTVIGVDQGDGGEPWNFATERAENGDFRIRIGEANTWLDPGRYRYRMLYEAPTWSHARAGEPDLVETRIDVPGFAWPTSIASTTFTVRAPGPISNVECVEGRLGTTSPCTTTPTVDGDVLRAQFGSFSDGESATIAFTTPADAFTASLPLYDATPLLDGPRFGPLDVSRPVAALIVGLLLMLPLVAWSVVKARVVYRDRVTNPALHDRVHPTALPAPPFGFRPAEVAGLLLRSPTNELFLSNLVDLDQRGALVSRTEHHGQTLVVLPPPPGNAIDPEDQRFVATLVPGAQPTRFENTYDAKVSARVNSATKQLTERAKNVFSDHGFKHSGGRLLRNTGFKALLAVGFALFALIVGLSMTALTALSFGAVIGVFVLVVGAYLIAHAPWRHHKLPLNSEGRDAVAQARSFREFVNTVEGEQLEWAAGQPGISHHHPALSLLPYAIALGLADSWFDRFGGVMQQLAVTAGAGAAAGGAYWYTNSSSFNTVKSTHSATTTDPSSSSSGGGGGGGGSGGGGGGGGSW